ncbi:hypothetical protein HYC85_004589 [Camellia sinensis]|uniref:Centromere protein X n=1 Tax=Camellia sinensis TaxID=4442 RepID=A0A7J7HZ08_CAMSI|nr:hypothetical protein HYC85_004589 [Camellia sinensis]
MSFPFPLYLYTKLRGVNARVGGRLFSRLVGWQPPFLTSLEVFIPAPFNSFQSLIWTSISFQNDQLSKRPPRDNVHSEREKNEGTETMEGEAGAGTSKKSRPTFANANALKLSCELLRVFVTEAVQRAATIAEAEGVSKIEATHLERILPQLLLDF